MRISDWSSDGCVSVRIVTVEAPAEHVVVATVRTASWPEAATGGGAAVEAASVEATLPAHTRYVGLAAGESDRPDLQSAKRVVSGGRGVGSEENFKIIFDFADKLGAAVGASRAAVDARSEEHTSELQS